MQRSLFQGEVTLHTWSDLTLTSHRVWRLKKEGDTQAIQSMLIDAVQAVSLERRSHPLLLLFALFCAAGSYAADAAVVGVGSALGGSSRVDLQACKLGTGRRFTTS
jgi:hypothetical protein